MSEKSVVKRVYRFRCDDFTTESAHEKGGIVDMKRGAKRITRRTFERNVCRDNLRMVERDLGYESHGSSGLTMRMDPHVYYFKGKLYGETVYGFVWSGYEHIFTMS